MILTQEQKMIVESDDQLLLINAYAGTGKTSTMVEYCRAKKGKRILYLAYNSSMAKEAKKKFHGLNVDSSTIHSLAFKEVGKNFKERLQQNVPLKTVHLLRYFQQGDYKSAKELMDAFKQFLFSGDSIEVFMNKNNELYSATLSKFPALWKDIISDSSMPFEHDFYLKIFQLSKPILNYEYIIVDEAQDLNPVMLAIILAQSAKKVFIGDSFQKIYGFRHCVNALEDLANFQNAKVLYLTETFRCPSEVIQIANPYLGILGAEKPLVSNKKIENNDLKKQEKKCIICRTNAKILEFVCMNPNAKIHFVGGIKSYNFEDIIDVLLLFSRNSDFKNNIKNPLYKNFNNAGDFIGYIKESNDLEAKGKMFLMFMLFRKKINIFELLKKMKNYSESEADYIITSAHKSKGLEWDHIFIQDDFINIKSALEKEESIDAEELNLLYVAITRARRTIDIPKDFIIDKELFLEARKKLNITYR